MTNHSRPGSLLATDDDTVRDELLMRRVSEGDETAFDDLLRLWWSEIARYAERLAGGYAAGEDVAQRTFLLVWERRSRWKPGGSPRAYLYRVARNLALNESRRRRIRRRWGELAPEDERYLATPEQVRAGKELDAAVAAAIAALPERRREVFELVRFHSLSYREVAQVMAISPQTVANQMSAALRSLRETLAGFLQDSPGSAPTRPTAVQQLPRAGSASRT